MQINTDNTYSLGKEMDKYNNENGSNSEKI
jgi:hypothetical protein